MIRSHLFGGKDPQKTDCPVANDRDFRTNHELAGLDASHIFADFLNDPAVLMTHGGRLRYLRDAAIGPEVRAADACGRQADNRVGGLFDPGFFPVLKSDIARSVKNSC
jgi:hypothetical protein